MAHTIDHKEEEIYKIQKGIEKRHNKFFNTGREHLTYAASIAKSLLPDPTSFQDVSEYLLDMKTGMQVGAKWGSKGGPKGTAAGAVVGGVTYPIGKRVVQEALPTLEELLEPVMRGFRGPQWQPALVDAGTGAISTPTPTNVKPVTSFKMSAIPNTEKIGGEGIVQRTATTQQIKSLLKDLDPSLAKRDVTKRYADNPEFLKKLSEVNTNVTEWLSGKGKGRLKGYPGERVIIAPDGVKYRIRDSNLRGQTGKFSINQDISAQNTAKIRKIAQQPDEGSLKKIFSKHVPKNKVDSVLNSYNQTNKKIYNALTAARKRYNIGKPKHLQTSIEHIFDVDFYKRLKDEVPGFAGKGADESWNLKMIPYVLNSKTGALNKKAKDIGQTLIESVRKDEFIDYNKVVKEFIDFDLGTKINKLKPKDWDKIIEFSMENPNLNMQQILLEYTKNL